MALSVYKKGQGTGARGIAGVVTVLLGTWAAVQMHNSPILAGTHGVTRAIAASIVGAIFAGLPLYLILFHHQVVDILIETQQEMRKVAWSTRQEVIGSTIVVLATVVILAVYILSMDSLVYVVFRLIGLLR